LVLAHVAEGVRLLASDREGHPDVVENVNLKGGALGAGRVGVVSGESAVRGGALAAAGEVNLRRAKRVWRASERSECGEPREGLR
jgi:hypothetical protein